MDEMHLEKPKVLPSKETKPQQLQERLSEIIAPIGEIISSVVAENMAAKLELAKIELPIKQETQRIQAKQLANAHEAEMHLRQHLSEKQKKEFWFGAIAGSSISVFMMVIACFLIYTGDKANGMAIVTLLVGAVGGFLGGAGWEKGKSRNAPENK